MNIIEAAEAAKAGKRVELSGEEARWVYGFFEWICNGITVPITCRTLSNNWRIIPDPPKLHPFSEAFERMKQGKWMKSIASDRVIALKDHWVAVLRGMNSHAVIDPFFTVYEIEGRWQEVAE